MRKNFMKHHFRAIFVVTVACVSAVSCCGAWGTLFAQESAESQTPPAAGTAEPAGNTQEPVTPADPSADPQKPVDPATEPQSQPGKPPDVAQGDDEVIATVNGEPITRGEIVEECLKVAGDDMVRDMIMRKLIGQELGKHVITNTPEEIEWRIERQLEMVASRVKGEYGIDLAAYLQAVGETPESIKEKLRKDVNLSKQLEMEKLVQYMILTDDQVEVRVLVVYDEQKAKKILEELKGGADFAKTAEKESQDGETATAGGKIEPFVRGMSTRGKAFEDAAFALAAEGDLSDVVRIEYGGKAGTWFYIMKLVSRRVKSGKKFVEMQDEVMKALREKEMVPEVLDGWLRNLRACSADGIKILREFKTK
jgi:foldase protein PrsA